MLIDLHVYATDAAGQPAANVAEPRGTAVLDGLCLVGRDALPPAAVVQALQAQAPELRVFVGIELTTDRGRLLCVPPRLDLPILPAAGAPPPPVLAVLGHLNALGVAVIAVQPYERDREPSAGDAVFGFDGIHAVEVRTDLSGPLDADLAVEAARAMGLPTVAGSGTPRAASAAPRLATAFARDVHDQAELAAALIEGDCWATDIGPAPATAPVRAPVAPVAAAPGPDAVSGAAAEVPEGDGSAAPAKRRRRRGRRHPRRDGSAATDGAAEGAAGANDAADDADGADE